MVIRTREAASVIKAIPGYEHYYASDDGKIFSDKSGELKELSQNPNTDGYAQVHFYHDHKDRLFKVANLVALTFIGPRPKDGRWDVCHQDGDINNNAASNLRYDTHANNVRDRITHGTSKIVPRGEKSGRAVLKEAQVREIKLLWREGNTAEIISAITGVNISTARDIGKGRTWKHIKV